MIIVIVAHRVAWSLKSQYLFRSMSGSLSGLHSCCLFFLEDFRPLYLFLPLQHHCALSSWSEGIWIYCFNALASLFPNNLFWVELSSVLPQEFSHLYPRVVIKTGVSPPIISILIISPFDYSQPWLLLLTCLTVSSQHSSGSGPGKPCGVMTSLREILKSSRTSIAGNRIDKN